MLALNSLPRQLTFMSEAQRELQGLHLVAMSEGKGQSRHWGIPNTANLSARLCAQHGETAQLTAEQNYSPFGRQGLAYYAVNYAVSWAFLGQSFGKSTWR